MKPSLLLLGHGSSKHPDSSTSVRRHAEILQQRGDYHYVRCAFLKEEPRIEDAFAEFEALGVGNLKIVPDFLAEGYFTQQVIPELLGDLPEGTVYLPPVGKHPLMQELILHAAERAMREGDWQQDEVSLLLIGHGSKRNKNSKHTLLQHIKKLKQDTSFAQIADLWLEESPFVSSWEDVARTKKVVIVPFLLSNGQHGDWDLNELLANALQHPTYQVRLTPALGVSEHFVEVIESYSGME